MWRTLRTWLRRSSFEDDMRDEMRFHLDARAADLVRRGLSPEAAARQARVEFGAIEKLKDEARAGAGLRWLDELAGDARYALRTFARNKGFAAAAIVTLALGIGANSTIFNLIDALILRALPVPHPERLLQLRLGSPADPEGDASFSYPMVQALDAEPDLFTGVAGFSGFGFSTGSGAALRHVRGAVVTGTFYDTLGLTPAAGRLLARADDVPGAPLVAVANFEYWRRELAAGGGVVGGTILINGVPVELVGVSPRGFAGANVGTVAELTVPVAAVPRLTPGMASLVGKGNSWLRVLARLRPGVTEAQAAARLTAVWPRIGDASIDPGWPAFRKDSVSNGVVRFTPGATGWTYLRELYVKPLRVLMAGVSLVLLIACANVSSLLLARASARRKEMAVRMAIGAGRGRLVRQLLVESLVLALAGAAAGVALATAGSRVLVALISSGGSPIVFDLAANWRLVAFTTAIASATALLFGLAPALHATGWGAGAALKDDFRTGSARLRLLPSLVMIQVALSLVLLIGAGLFVRTLRNLQGVDTGFDAQGVLLVEFERGAVRMPAPVLDAVRAIPGVVSAGVATHTPLSGSTWSEPVVPAGRTLPERDTAVLVGASPAVFDALGMTLVSGRDFNSGDTAQSPGVAIVNERYAAAYFPHENPVGRRLTAMLNGVRCDLAIVGVARNVSSSGLRSAPPRTVYVAYAQIPGSVAQTPASSPATVIVRATGSIADVSAALKRTLQPISPLTPLDVLPLTGQVREAIASERLMAALASAFGGLALVLAGIGIYGLLAYTVARRTREIGIRVALGAHRARVVGLVVRSTLTPLLAGVALALPAAWALARLLDSMLFGLRGTDPSTMAGAIALLVLVAQLAAFLPARRAARVNPISALRSE